MPARSTAAPEVRAKRIAQAAIRKANAIANDERVVRSTRTRTAYKVKAEALDRVVAILSGKE